MNKKNVFSIGVLVAMLSACQPTTQSTHTDLTDWPEMKLGVSVSSDLDFVYFDRATNAEFKKLAKENPSIKMTMTNSNDDVALQQKQIREMLDSGVQAIVLHLGNANPDQVQETVDMICSRGVPAVYFNVYPGDKAFSSCKNAYFVDTDNIRIGVDQGLEVLRQWKEHPEWDKNKDGIIQFAQIKAMPDWSITNERTQWPITTINNYPNLHTDSQKLMDGFGLFDENVAEKVVDEWIANHPDFANVEVILSNDDDMGLAAVKSLKKHNMMLPVFGADGSDAAREAIKSGDLRGTVFANMEAQIDTAVRLANNIVSKRPLQNAIPYAIDNRKIKVLPTEVNVSAK